MAEQQVHYPDAHEQQLPDSNPELNEDCKKEHEPFKLVIPIPIPNVIWNYKKSLIFWFNNRNELFDNNIEDKLVPRFYKNVQTIVANASGIFALSCGIIAFLNNASDCQRYNDLNIGSTILFGLASGFSGRWIGSYIGRWWPISLPILTGVAILHKVTIRI